MAVSAAGLKRAAAPHLIFLIGLPGSGKSFLAQKLLQAHPERSLISTDAIRTHLFGDEAIQGSWRLIQQELQLQFQRAVQRRPVGDQPTAIYDATNVRRKNRREAIAQIRAIGFRQITGIWLDTPLSICLERNRQRSRQVPEAVILRMDRQLRGAPPSLSDGLDSLQRCGISRQSHHSDREKG
ncbi:MAG TPA: AAA family ATPase [Coleofasciculaceae cyanobacterium]